MQNELTQLLGTKYPIIQGGMIWCSTWQLASAVSNAGGLGVIGSGSMYPQELEQNILQCKQHTTKPFAVNIPLLYPDLEQHIQLCITHQVPVVITSAGNPATHTAKLKEHGITVLHVVSNLKFALKCQQAGVDAIIAEGFEAGGHNGREETTTMCLIPLLRPHINLPLVAAGGIGSGQAMAAALCLGADGVQVGSRFVASHESAAHINFKQAVVQATDGNTDLTLKEITPVRLLKNEFYHQVQQAYAANATKQQLEQLLGRGRAKKGMHLGDTAEGELEIGQVSASINIIFPAAQILEYLVEQCQQSLKQLQLYII